MKKFILSLGIISLLTACGTATPKAEAAITTPTKSTAKPIELTSSEFKTKVADYTAKQWKYLGDKPAVVDFYATWCGPCKQIAPILNELAAKYDGKIVIYKVDVDQAPEVAAAYGISSIPTLLFIPTADKQPTIKQGALPKTEIENLIKNIMSN